MGYVDSTKAGQHAAPVVMGTPAAASDLSPRGAGASVDGEETGEYEHRKRWPLTSGARGQNDLFLFLLAPF